MIDELSLTYPLIERTGWTLLHSLWQGTLVAVVLAGLLHLLRRQSAELRYLVCLTALTLLTAIPITTWVLLSERTAAAPPQELAPASALLVTPTAEASANPNVWTARLQAAAAPAIPWLVAAWSLGVVLLSVRLLGGWISTRRLRTRGAQAPPERWMQHLPGLVRRMEIRRPIQLVQSALADTPMVIGWLRPVILVPAGLFAGLPPAQVEAILLHELAHVRRHDYLVNLLQSVVETLLFYHPAVWWISSRLRQEREYCCDDAAARVCRSRRTYAEALTELETQRSVGWMPAPAATDGALLTRIRRLLVDRPASRSYSTTHVAAGFGALFVAGALVLAACSPEPLSAGGTDEPAPGAAAAADTTAERTSPGRSVIVYRTDAGEDTSRSVRHTRDNMIIRSDSTSDGRSPDVHAFWADSMFDADSLEAHVASRMRRMHRRIDSLHEAGAFDMDGMMQQINDALENVPGRDGDSLRIFGQAIPFPHPPRLDSLARHPALAPLMPPSPPSDTLYGIMSHALDSVLRHDLPPDSLFDHLRRGRLLHNHGQRDELLEEHAQRLERQAQRMQERAEEMRREADRLRREEQQQQEQDK